MDGHAEVPNTSDLDPPVERGSMSNLCRRTSRMRSTSIESDSAGFVIEVRGVREAAGAGGGEFKGTVRWVA